MSDFFYSFFHLGEVGESLWVGRGYPAKTYRSWLEIFRELRMVEVKPGAKPVPVVGYTRALELYATSYLEEPDFFKGVRRHRLTYPANAKVVSGSSPAGEAQPAVQGSTSTSTASSKVEVEL